MKSKLLIAGFSGLTIILAGCETGKAGGSSSSVTSLSSTKDSISYAIGNDISRSLEMIKDEINIDVLVKALRDNNTGSDLLLKPEDSQELMQEFSKSMGQKQQQKMAESAQKNSDEGTKFLEENKAKEGVVTTESGLQYQVISEGSGPKPKESDKVTVHYKGTLLDGTEFDSSHKRGQPATFQVNQVIKGWTEALMLMNTGSKYQLFIPAELGYGPSGSGQAIGPNATLIFEVELISIDS